MESIDAVKAAFEGMVGNTLDCCVCSVWTNKVGRGKER